MMASNGTSQPHVAVVTGGSRGIGRGVVPRLAGHSLARITRALGEAGIRAQRDGNDPWSP
jgi:NAD(P)-dependent dehydrogenase (short-subunit alcohol dehydrogenase family)